MNETDTKLEEQAEAEEFEINEVDALKLQLVHETLSKLEAQKALALIDRDAVYAGINAKYSDGGKYKLGDVNVSARKGTRTLINGKG